MKSVIKTWNEDTVCDVSVFSKMMNGLYKEKESWLSGKFSPREKVELVEDLISKAVRFEHLPDMLFWGLEHPQNMPSDARVDFLYMPTYIVTSMMMDAYRHFSEIREIEGIEDLIHDALNACMGRNFMGHGYDADPGFLDTMSIFGDFRVDLFLSEHPAMNSAFVKQFENAMVHLGKLESGEVIDPWTKAPYHGVSLIAGRFRGEKAVLPVFVYGTLKHDEPAHHLMGDAIALGDVHLEDFALVNLGTYPGMVREDGACVSGEMYLISYETLGKLDTYEGEGHLYQRVKTQFEYCGHFVNVFLYLYLEDVSHLPRIEEWSSRRNDENISKDIVYIKN